MIVWWLYFIVFAARVEEVDGNLRERRLLEKMVIIQDILARVVSKCLKFELIVNGLEKNFLQI